MKNGREKPREAPRRVAVAAGATERIGETPGRRDQAILSPAVGPELAS
jgi:hypothetical protein